MSEEQHEETGRRAVRRHLIDPLEADGMTRKRSVTVDDHRAFLDRVAEKLAYMAPDALDALRPIVRGLATGTALNIWPDVATILNYAYQLQPPPDRSDDILCSWLRSVEGPRHRAEGSLYALRLFVKKFRRPPSGDFAMARIREKQREVDRDIEALRQLRGSGDATDSQLRTLTEYERVVAELEALVDEGERRRAEKRAAGVAA